MKRELVLTHARVVLAHEVLNDATVVVRDGYIAEVSESPSALSQAEDLQGDWLLPGLVEVHTDNLERHVMPRPKVTFPMEGAVQSHDAEIATAGITTVLDAIGSKTPACCAPTI
jgi:alpha-D-ribose 1-methylphosphonate 5-triphosphate diphosphatase